MLQEHMGESGMLTKKRVKFDKKDKEGRTWKNGKEYYHDTIGDLEVLT